MADEKKTPDVPFDPASLVENAFLLGIGVLELTKEKTQGLANELIEKGKMSQGDAKKVADTISEIAEKQQKTMRQTVAEETDKVLKTSGVATKAEFDDLKKQIAELKDMLAKQGGAGTTTE
jgi:polyhydroxyalkanoate synthesis regulator phasin